MTASPAQVANDLMAQYKVRCKSHRNEKAMGETLRRCAEMIREMLGGHKIDDGRFRAVHRQMTDLAFRYRNDFGVGMSIDRGVVALTTLRAERP